MREHLFKAKKENNGEWVEGCYVVTYFGRGVDTPYICDKESIMYRIDSKTVCKYIGLNDDNRKKIFENDILRCTDKVNDFEFIAVVEFGNPNRLNSWGYQLRIISGGENVNPDILLWVDTEMEEVTGCEVIGNIFDNADLLKGGDEV